MPAAPAPGGLARSRVRDESDARLAPARGRAHAGRRKEPLRRDGRGMTILQPETYDAESTPHTPGPTPLMRFPDDLVERLAGGEPITLIVLDGVGGLPHPSTGLTELESAGTPNLDRLAAESSLGMHVPVAPGVTPGSGPAHLALFGYDPARTLIGRGVLAALGVGIRLREGDVAARLNLATLDERGRVTDRRAGRPDNAKGRRVVRRLRAGVSAPPGVDLHFQHVMEHRAVMVLRGKGLGANVTDTDPQRTGTPPRPARSPAGDDASACTAGIASRILEQATQVLAREPVANGLLARGFAEFRAPPGFQQRYGLKATAVARYPMYRGVASLVGMELAGPPGSDEEAAELMEAAAGRADFRFFHYKATDSRGEDGDFDGKVAAIEAADRLLPRLTDEGVVIVTGDHCTPATLGAHSWHAVPLLIRSRCARPTGRRLTETECRRGDLGVVAARHIMSLALAHAGRLAKFGS